VKQGLDDIEAGMSRSMEKAAIQSLVGSETIDQVFEGTILDEGGAQTVSL
jgi:hypothetical protein